MNDKTRQFAVLITAIIQVTINTLIGTGIYDFGLASTQAISDSLPNYFTPAGYTFLVWNVIFLGVLAYAVYQMLPSQTERIVHREIGWWAVAANIGNGLWPLVWGAGGMKGSENFEPALHVASGVIIVGILFSLLMIFVRLRNMQPSLSTRDEWLIHAPYTTFFAWLNIATVANVTAILVALDVDSGTSGAYWSVAMISVATLLAVILIFYNRGLIGTVAFSAIIIWAFFGVTSGNIEQSNLVGIAAIIGAMIVFAATIFRFMVNSEENSLIPSSLTT